MEQLRNLHMKNTNNYTSAQGFWKVTTEGDCEGKSIRDLGVHYGYLDDIAFALADKCYYSLCFKLVDPMTLDVPTKNKVNIVLDIDSGTWDMASSSRVAFVENMLKDRDVSVKASNYFASVELAMGKTIEQQKAREKEMLKKQALSKLSEAERSALGF